MIDCSNCGTAMEDDLRFCTECGTPNPTTRTGDTTVSLGAVPTLQVPASDAIKFQTPPTPQITGPFNQVRAGGATLQGNAPVQQAPPSPNRTPLIIVGVVCGLLLLMLGGVASKLLLSDNKPKEKMSDTAQTPTTPSNVAASPERSSETPTSRMPNLSGEWILVNTIERTSFPAFTKLRVGYHLTITQAGTEFKAEGEKYLENGLEMNPSQRTPIRVNGSVSYDTVRGTFVEEGLRRTTTGSFDWRLLSDANELRGTFVSSAAKSSGSSVATRSH